MTAGQDYLVQCKRPRGPVVTYGPARYVETVGDHLLFWWHEQRVKLSVDRAVLAAEPIPVESAE